MVVLKSKCNALHCLSVRLDPRVWNSIHIQRDRCDSGEWRSELVFILQLPAG